MDLRAGGATAPVVFELSIPKAVLTSELGSRRETLSQLFGKLRKKGAVKVRVKTITVTFSNVLPPSE
jgi:CRP-like cAMP-binding protein